MLIENIKLAFFSLMANKLRTLLTMLGIIIGIASVIAIMTVGNSITASVRTQMSSFGTRNISTYVYQDYETMEFDEFGEQIIDEENRVVMTPDRLRQLLEHFDGKIEAIAVQRYVGYGKSTVPGEKGEDDRTASLSIVGVSPGFFKAQKINIIAGSGIDAAAYSEGAAICIVSDILVKNLYGEDTDMNSVLGKSIEFSLDGNEGTQFLNYVVGAVYEYEMNTWMLSQNINPQDISTDVYVPYKNAILQSSDQRAGDITDFTVVAAEDADVIKLSEDMKTYIPTLFPAESHAMADAWSMEASIKETMSMLDSITLGISLIAGIALLVGGIGVMNIMTVSITERTREIGTRKALGAPNGAIRMQFITEAVIMCLMGGLLGMIIGLVVGNVASTLMGYPARVSVASILVSVGFSMFIGIFFGYYPANRAAKMDPIEALRYE